MRRISSNRGRVADLMTRSVVKIAPWTTVREARQLTTQLQIRHLLVAERDDLVGVVCVCDLRDGAADELVSDRMKDPITVHPAATVSEASDAMRELALGCLPVVDGNSVVGIITRGDLIRAGHPAESTGARTCAACGYPHNVEPDRRSEEVGFCLYCRERSVPASLDDEMGGGD